MHFELIQRIQDRIEIIVSEEFIESVFQNKEKRRLFSIYLILFFANDVWKDEMKIFSFQEVASVLSKKSQRTVRNYLKISKDNDWYKDSKSTELKSADEIFSISKVSLQPKIDVVLRLHNINDSICYFVLVRNLKSQKNAIHIKAKSKEPIKNPNLVLTHLKITQLLGLKSSASAIKLKKLLVENGIEKVQIPQDFKLKKFGRRVKRHPDFFRFRKKSD